jgi:hypothetical protein
MATWLEFERAAPAIAAAGRALLYQHGPGLAYLATVRRDGGPRVHPICPVIVEGGLYALIGESPKRNDLLRDGRYALHSFPAVAVDDEFYLTGRARRVDDAARRAAVSAAFAAQGTTHDQSDVLFELHIEHALHAKYGPRPSWPPAYAKWRAPNVKREA